MQMSEKRKIGVYILIKIAPGKSRWITEQIGRVDGVKIQTVEGVLRTHTAIVGELVTTGGG